ncbi:integral membrane protein [Paraphaeosphaeria minitans]|uniref:Integral membrane protein n=1 Tax=Paraphaeosphaeria minitans TaxID=565426 RepID=A0A9P6GG36_9PLEO|nr:integral membrane protein [Paraphaeosphaeria minitans]
MSLFGCRPIAASWNLSLTTTAKCLDQLTKYMTLSVLNIIIDVFELALPIPIVIPLQTSNLQKGLCLPYVCDWYIVGLAPSR